MDQKQFETTLHDAEIRLRRLKTLYDQWLAGFERTEPTVPRNELEDILRRLRAEQIRNTALRFRLQQVHQRYTMFMTYWRRIGRQIEEGTYQRDVLKARKIRERNSAREPGHAEESYDVAVEDDVDAALRDAARAADEVAALAQGAASSRSASQRPPAPSASPEPPHSTPAPERDVLELPSSVGPVPSRAPAPPAPLTSPTPSGRPAPPPVPPRASVAPRTISPFAMPLPGANNSMRAPPPIPAAAMKPGNGAPTSLAPAPRAAPTSMPSPATAPRPSLAAARPQPAQAHANPNAGLSSDDVQRIYAKYVAARKNNAERTDNVKLETIEKSLRGMLPQLEKKHAGKKIDFEVIVKDGKVALKPVAK
jgi:hypothetical protein